MIEDLKSERQRIQNPTVNGGIGMLKKRTRKCEGWLSLARRNKQSLALWSTAHGIFATTENQNESNYTCNQREDNACI